MSETRQPKFRYYVTRTSTGEILGTDDVDIAQSLSKSVDNYVVDALTGEWFDEAGGTSIVERINHEDQ